MDELTRMWRKVTSQSLKPHTPTEYTWIPACTDSVIESIFKYNVKIGPVDLITATEAHLPFLISCNSDVEGMRMLGYTYRISPERFKDDMYSWNVLQIIVTESPIGFVKANVNPDDKNANVSLYLVPKARGWGISHLVMRPFLSLLFDTLSLHKVQFAVWEFNKSSLNNFKQYLNLDAILREDAYYQGRYWDKFVFSVVDREWTTVKNQLVIMEERANKLLTKRKERRRAISETVLG